MAQIFHADTGIRTARGLEELVADRGAFPLVDCHRHLDTAGTFNDEDSAFHITSPTVPQKWQYVDTKKRKAEYLDGLPARLEAEFRRMRNLGVGACRTYCPVDPIVGLHALEAMLEAKARWKLRGFYLQVMVYPFMGLDGERERELARRGLELADGLGCLFARGRADVTDSMTSLNNMLVHFAIAHEQKKPLDCQIDQDNDPDERESLMLVEVARKYRMAGYTSGITATHCISLAAYRREDWALRERILEMMSEFDISVVVCPSAARDMPAPDKDAPIHNSIAPWPLMLQHGITVGIGADNLRDIYGRLNNGNLYEEARQMVGAVRYHGPLETVADIMTVNGRKILGLAQ